MVRMGLKIATGLGAAAMLTAGSAFAQAGGPAEPAFRFGESPLFTVQELEAAVAVSLPSAPRQGDGETSMAGLPQSGGLEPVVQAADTGSASALPWYERFTVSTPSEFRSAWGEEAAEFRFSAGERWGFTLGLAETERGPQFELDDVSAGAFYELNSRFRVGTNLRFSSPTQDVFGQQGEERVPELKFESAFRF